MSNNKTSLKYKEELSHNYQKFTGLCIGKRIPRDQTTT